MLHKVLLATANSGKSAEMKLALSHSGIEFLSLKEAEKLIGKPAPEVVEDGQSYFENCLIKARAYQLWSGLPVIADDTGLEVEVLNGAPGIFSARYAGDNVSSEIRNQKLLSELGHSGMRAAKFVCELIFLISADEYSSARGELPGFIAREIYGRGGFGYDSVFIVSGTEQTLAQIKEFNPEFKTHRKIALQSLNNSDLFKRFIESN